MLVNMPIDMAGIIVGHIPAAGPRPVQISCL